ncbi:GGDEF domain-containing protein [Celeribacter baekdonensis]|uniref:GGDEF domain-containing protein n=1 Tax=Celeribacter baekdonensis TaxID=875171 RepID=UPI0030D7E085|tara:strand:+ start:63989 stop:64996 length:1008 start_codon:yes stop_codon:yes gene_type:complete
MVGKSDFINGFKVPGALGAPLIAKYITSISLFILPIAIVKYAIKGNYLLSGYFVVLSAVMAFDLWAHLKSRRLPINATMVLIAVHIGDLMLVANHGISSAFWAFPITIAGFFFSAHWVALVLGVAVAVLEVAVSYWAAQDFWFSFRLGMALITTILFMRYTLVTIGRLQAQLTDTLNYDALTGCRNRRAFMAMEQKGGLGSGGVVLFVDIDHFKEINDRYGHFVGDDILRNVAGLMREVLHGEGLLFRIGGEEFAIVLLKMPEDMGMRVAERIRQVISDAAMPEEARVTVSIGVEIYRAHGDLGAALRRADDHLYRAKQAGRNQVMNSRHTLHRP